MPTIELERGKSPSENTVAEFPQLEAVRLIMDKYMVSLSYYINDKMITTVTTVVLYTYCKRLSVCYALRSSPKSIN